MARAAGRSAATIRVGLIGFGTIGTGVVTLLQQNATRIRENVGVGIDLVRIGDIDTTRERGVKLGPGVLVPDASRILDDPNIDVVVELMGGVTTARRFVLDAIAKGKDVVTANKALLALHGHEVFAAAEKAGVAVGFEASVGGGIPIIRTLKEALAGDRNRAIHGIVNGTSNYILSRMTSERQPFDEVLKAAQASGLAEANPTYDVDGIDAAHKLSLLIQLAFGRRVRFDDIAIEGIREIAPVDIAFAEDFGYVIKLLAIAKDEGQRIEARVHPTMVPRQHLLANVNGALNAIVVHGAALGDSMYLGLGAGMMPTATAVVADLIDVARNHRSGSRARVPPLGYPLRLQRQVAVKPLANLESEYYLRFMVVDRPGVLAQIAGLLGRAGISIAAVIQKERERGAAVPIVIRTHHARERDLRRALQRIDRMAAVRAKSTCIRIEENLR